MRYYVSWKTTGYYRNERQPKIGDALSCQRMLAFLLKHEAVKALEAKAALPGD